MSTVTQTPGTTLRLKYRDSSGNDQDITYPIQSSTVDYPGIRPTRNRMQTGIVLFIEDFRHPQNGMYNDAKGSASRDNEVVFCGLPTCRLDPQGNTTTSSNPGPGGPDTNGLVFKRRITDNYSAKFGWEGWFRYTSNNNLGSANLIGPTFSIYNRDGTNWTGGRFWIDSTGGGFNLSLKILDSNGTWVQKGNTVAVDDNQHPYAIFAGADDHAGAWHYVKLVVDMVNKKYVSIQFDDQTVALTDTLRSTADTGPRVMHFSVEYAQKTATRRFINIAQMVGTKE